MGIKKLIAKYKMYFEIPADDISRETFSGELNYESGKVFYLVFICGVMLLPFIPQDLEMHAYPVLIISIKIILTLLCAVLVALRFTKRFKHEPKLLIMIMVVYLYFASAIMMASSGEHAATYISSFSLSFLMPAFTPLTLKFKIWSSAFGVMVFAVAAFLFGIDFSDVPTQNAASTLFLVVLITLALAYSQQNLRYKTWTQRNELKTLVATLNNEREQKVLENIQLMLDVAPMVVIIFDLSTRTMINCSNEAIRTFGFTNKDELIKAFNERFLDFSAEYQPCGTPTMEKIAYAFEQAALGNRLQLEWSHITNDGNTMPAELTIVSTVNSGTSLMLVYIRDLTHERAVEAQRRNLEIAEESNRAKSKFLARMSHEMRTPMNSVLGIAELQLQKEAHPPETEEAFWRIYSSSNMLLSIINDILDLSKVEAGKMEINPITYETASMIIDTAQLNIMYIGSKRIEFKLNIDENFPMYLIGDELRIKQVLNNLLSNAFKYTMEGTVSLSLSVEESHETDDVTIIAIISDTGQGMNKEQLGTLFEEFSRFNKHSNRNIEGSGLGLTITNQLVQMMGGEILVESEPEKGSTFTVRLPQKKKGKDIIGPEAATSMQNLENTQKSLKRITKMDIEPMPYGRVLVVDDVESNLYVAKGFFMPYKLTIETADSGATAIAKIESGSIYDIIFMDHMMPDMDGIETTKIIRSMGYEHPIVALTANAFSDSVQMFMDSGFTGYASKPMDFYQLDKYLKCFIHNKQPHEALENMHTSTENDTKTDLDHTLEDSFLSDAKKALEILGRTIEKNTYDAKDLKSYITQVHAMRSALINIKRPYHSEIAGALEVAGRNEDIEYIKTETPAFMDSLSEIIDGIELKKERDATEKPSEEYTDAEYLHSRLLTISEACENLEIDIVSDTLKDLRKENLPSQAKKLLSEISDLLLTGDIEEVGNIAKDFANNNL